MTDILENQTNNLKYQKQIEQWANDYIGLDFEFREHQIEAINDIIDSVLNEKTDVKIIEAPTGSGKSLIAIIAAGVLNKYYKKSSYILCSDLYLFGQYESFIKQHKKINFGMLKGQTGNYQCMMNGNDIRNAECRIAKIPWPRLYDLSSSEAQRFKCCNLCEYVKTRKQAQKSNVTLMTYQLYFYQINTAKENSKAPFKQRDVIFCDECHNIPSIVQSQHTQVVKEADLDKFIEIYNFNLQLHTGLFSDDTECQNLRDIWADSGVLRSEFMNIWNKMLYDKDDSAQAIFDFNKNIVNELCNTVDVIEEAIRIRQQTQHSLTKRDYELYKVTSWYRNYHCFLTDFTDAIAACGPQYLVKQVAGPDEVNPDKEYTVSFSCVKEDWMCWTYLLSTPKNQAVLMSATVGGKKAFDENLGITAYAEKPSHMSVIPSTFDFSQSPVIISKYAYYMNYDRIDKNTPKISNQVASICNKFNTFHGMIQTGSYKIAYNIFSRLPNDIKRRIFIYKDSKDKDLILRKFKESTNGILIGPTLNEGIDLPDDLCRFIIIAKVPYPSLADKLVKRKMELFPEWYTSTTSNQIIQGIGRGNRNKHDWCVTYILDGCFHNLFKQTQKQYSKELQNRIKVI